MLDLARVLTDGDLGYLARIAAPQAKDPAALVRAARQDADILSGMLRDARLYRHLLAEPERVVTVSPRLFFAVLLVRVRTDLEHTTYTVEQEDRHRTVVFDSREVADFMHRGDVLAYLVSLLVSFLRIRTQSFAVRLRKGTWRRVEYNDMDLDGLVALGERVGPERLFPLERRIGDVCLFRSSFCPGSEAPSRAPGGGPPRGRGELAEIGRRYYRLASRRGEARELDVGETLETLAERFDTAVKPLDLLARRYLDGLRDHAFAG
jgi:hypothetical protein